MRIWFTLLLGLTTGVASASPGKLVPGETVLYVKTRSAPLMPSTRATAVPVRLLQPGEQVTWLGADRKQRRWQRVRVAGKTGFLLASSLSTRPPPREVTAAEGQAAGDASAYLSSGAATKALTPGAVAYGQELKMEEAVAQIQALEALAERIAEPEIAAHARAAGLFPVVGATSAQLSTGGQR